MAQKTVRYIAPTITAQSNIQNPYHQKKVAAYCRVSTKQDEQLNSYEVQTQYYTEKINGEPKWCLAGIYADKGITGTSTKNRDSFNRMIRDCKKGKIDLIITKSISRFARNTLDCLKYVRMLKEINVDIFFEEQGIHSTDPGAEFYITIYGSIAQSESENISANVRWGKDQSAREGKVSFVYSNFLGYKRGADGQPEIVPEEAEIVKIIYDRYLKGDSLKVIADFLTSQRVSTPKGKEVWSSSTIKSILSNEKYMGDALINKTYTVDFLSKKVKANNGERPKYYVENNHPAIIDKNTFNRVQEELARRSGKRKVKFVGTKTEQGKYSSKYALTELLICGECGTPYRRCTWTTRDKKKKIVWRCINRLDYGKKYCKHSPSIEESVLQNAIMDAILKMSKENAEVLKTLKSHIAMGLNADDIKDNSIELQIRIAEIDAEWQKIINGTTTENENDSDREFIMEKLLTEKKQLKKQLEEIETLKKNKQLTMSKLDEIYSVIDLLRNHPITYDEQIVREILECVVVESKDSIKVVFKGGYSTNVFLIK